MQLHQLGNGITASVLGWSRALVTARAKILELPDAAQQLLGSGQLPVSAVDPRAFSPDELRAGWRLACRAQATQDLRVVVPSQEWSFTAGGDLDPAFDLLGSAA